MQYRLMVSIMGRGRYICAGLYQSYEEAESDAFSIYSDTGKMWYIEEVKANG